MKAPVSLCVISRRDPHLRDMLGSVAPYVSEVVIVCNDATDTETAGIAQEYGARYEVYLGANDAEGRIDDFAQLRNHGLELATQPWVMWADSDDLVVHADALAGLVARLEPNQGVLLPYEYGYDPAGRCICRHYRERIWARGRCRFVGRVHEVAVPDPPGLVMAKSDEVLYQHRRQYIARPAEANRNLRILEAMAVDERRENPRTLYYLGLEQANAGRAVEAEQTLAEYVERSGFPDERAMALYRLVELCEQRKDYSAALRWAWEAAKANDWFESEYALTRSFYFAGEHSRALRHGKTALERPPTDTLLFVDETQRQTIKRYLTVSANAAGDVESARRYNRDVLESYPDDPLARYNEGLFASALDAGAGLLGTGDAPPASSPSGGGVPQVPPHYSPGRLRIGFVTYPAPEPWDATSVDTTGIGGSETMMAHMARLLAAKSHAVTVGANPPCVAVHDGVKYVPWQDMAGQYDVLVVSRYADLLERQVLRATVKILWCHDVMAHHATAARMLKADRVLALSEWHRQNLIAVHGLPPDQVIKTRNGIDYSRFDQPVARNPYRCINASSPDRSWPVLLDIWPRILEREPKASLHLFYGFDTWRKCADPKQLELIARLEQQIARTKGVFYEGRVNQQRLAAEYLASGVWVYPTWFWETSCIGAMEAQAAGCHVVTSRRAALPETIRDPGAALLDGEWTSPEYQAQFVEAAVQALHKPARPRAVHSEHSLRTLADDWEDMFHRLLEETSRCPIPAYQPTEAYR